MPKHVGSNRLTSLQCKNAAGPAVLEDGAGLRLVVDKSGARRWVLRASVGGKRRDFGLGSYQFVSLKQARDRAAEFRRRIESGDEMHSIVKAGADSKRAPMRQVVVPPSSPDVITVRDTFREFWRIKKPQLANAKHVAQWVSTLETYAMPSLGTRSVAEVTTRDIAAVLQPIWREVP